jgi:N-acyl-D-amino-acid deacylase
VVDGSGSPSFFGAIAIERGRVWIIRGNVDTVDAHTRINAAEHVVAPGFIDVHSHSGLMLQQNPHHEIKVRQGVTTELIGVDGNSYAPFRNSGDLHQFVRMNAGLDGHPPIDYTWNTVAEYLSVFHRKAAVNVAFLIGNSALRICAVGWDDDRATNAQLADMQALLREGLAEGAFGLSTGLDYPPGSYATTDELVALSQTVADLGGIYHTHVRYQLGDRFLDPFREAIEIGERSGVPIHLTHLYRRSNAPGGAAEMLDLVESARARGLDTTFDAYPYEWNSTRLLILLPAWVQEGGPDAILERLRDPVLASRIRRGLDERGEQYGAQTWNHLRVGYFSKPENNEYEGKTIAEIAKLRQQTPSDAICELLLSEDLRLNEVAASPDPWSLQKFVIHPLSMVGSDSIFIGDRPSPRTYGTFPRILGDLVRDERLMSLPEAIRKMTSYPAQRLGLPDRGLLRDGMAADVVVFDPALVRSLATYDDPRRYPVGIRDVFVNGEPVLLGGEITGALPGLSLKRQGSSS